MEMCFRRKGQNIRMTQIRRSSYDEQEEFGGVYLGPPDTTKFQNPPPDYNSM
jgi:hypothetical protein